MTAKDFLRKEEYTEGGEGYMYYDPVILTDKEEDEVMQNWIEKQRKYAENKN